MLRDLYERSIYLSGNMNKDYLLFAVFSFVQHGAQFWKYLRDNSSEIEQVNASKNSSCYKYKKLKNPNRS